MSKVPLMQYADAFGIIQPTFPSWTVHPLLMLGSMVEESVEACEVAHTSNKKMSSQHSSDFRTGQRRCLAFTPTRKSSSQRTCMDCTTSRTKHRADGRLLQQLSLSSSDGGALPGSRQRVFGIGRSHTGASAVRTFCSLATVSLVSRINRRASARTSAFSSPSEVSRL
jgi:hypothetical protein